MNKFHIYHVLHVVGIGVFIEALFIALCIPVGLIYHEDVTFLWQLVIGVLSITGVILFITRKKVITVGIKDNILCVVLTWITLAFVGALPYILSDSIPKFVDALFESISGFTTTGSSILTHIEGLPKAILFWRSLTHWLGGMGVIVLVIALIPYFKIGGQQMMLAEGALFSTEKIKSRTIDVAKRMWFIYLVLTLMETVALNLAGMNTFDAICHSFATIATGGFSTYDTSLVDVSPTIQYIVITFMILAGMNFSLHYLFVHGRFKRFFNDEELIAYSLIIFISSLLITIELVRKLDSNFELAFRQSLFQISSIITATGFVSADYSQWSVLAKAIILIVMLIGACVGSTGGGVKVARYLIVIKGVNLHLRSIMNPNTIHLARFNSKPISSNVQSSIIGFIFLYYGTIVFGSFVMVMTGLDAKSAISSIITTLGGIGPGFGAVGPVENFSSISECGKYYLSFNMILGRLEIMSVLVLFLPSFYRQ